MTFINSSKMILLIRVRIIVFTKESLKGIISFLFLFSSPNIMAQVTKTIFVSPGGLSNVLSTNEKTTITDLIVIGSVDARDFKTMRDQMPALANVDLIGSTISAYNGTEGTDWRQAYGYYLANQIPDYCFSLTYTTGKSSLKSFKMPENVVLIGERAFLGCNGLVNISISKNLESIKDYAFQYCMSLTTITLPLSLKSLGGAAFSNTNLSSINIPPLVKIISAYLFQNCANLENVNISGDLEKIDNNAFMLCAKLKTINLPQSVRYIGNSAFYGSSNLSSIIIPDSLSYLGNGAFNACGKLTAIKIPKTISELLSDVFNNCSSLNAIEMEPSIEKIGNYSFKDCSSILSLNLPASLKEIGMSAFMYSNKIKKITLPGSVTKIGDMAFYGCSALDTIICYNPSPTVFLSTDDPFYNVNKSSCKLLVPIGSKNLYKAALKWKDFSNIQEVSEPVVPSISISFSEENICKEAKITISSLSANGGVNPYFLWKVNGVNLGFFSENLSFSNFNNNDTISCILFSSLPFASPAFVSSNKIILNVNDIVVPSLSIAGNFIISLGQSTIINSTYYNSGPNPSFKWQDSTSTHNWQTITGATSQTINYSPQKTGDKLKCQLTSDAVCASPSTVSSNILVFTVTATTSILDPQSPSMPICIAPNPARQQMNLLGLQSRGRYIYSLADYTGKVLLNGNIINTTRQQINISKIPAGVYLFRLYNMQEGKLIGTEKIIILR